VGASPQSRELPGHTLRQVGASVSQSGSGGAQPGTAHLGNALSVALTTWPLMPLAIYAFHAWLFPDNQPRWLGMTMPIVLVLCYVIEIAVLWHLLY
jgi:hypothetical protein